MPFIEMGKEFGEVHDPGIAPEDVYDLKCRMVEHITESGKNHIRVIVDFEGAEDEYQPIFHYIGLPIAERDAARDDEKGRQPGTTAQMKMLMAKRFLAHFNVPFEDNGFDPNDIVGAVARCSVIQDTFESEGRPPRLTNKLGDLPRLPDEKAQAA